jgi:hypothetical protein
MSENEPNIIKEFQNLYNYVVLMGKHINGIHSRLDTLEASLKEIDLIYNNFVRENTAEMTMIKETMLKKDEFNNFIEKMKISIGENLPALPILSQETPPSIDESQQNTVSSDG